MSGRAPLWSHRFARNWRHIQLFRLLNEDNESQIVTGAGETSPSYRTQRLGAFWLGIIGDT